MTFEELRAESAKLGYKLVKISEQKYIPLKPCPVCGKKNTSVWYGNFGMMFGQVRRCNKCEFEGFPGLNEKGSREGWNNAVEYYLETLKENHE